jgi:hypothetical protein
MTVNWFTASQSLGLEVVEIDQPDDFCPDRAIFAPALHSDAVP